MRAIRRLRAVTKGDDGYSIMEVMIGMTIMSIVMVVVTGAISQIYSATNRTEGTATARDQLSNVFRRLDKELRYAQWVNTPGQVGNRWYVEYAMPNKACRQLVFNTGTGNLALASWTLPGTTPGAATPIATSLATISGVAPFTVYAAGSAPYASASPGTSGVGKNFSSDYAQVRIQMNGVVGRTMLPLDLVFTAQNTSRNTPVLNDCRKGRPTS